MLVGIDELTPREREVLDAIIQYGLYKEVAYQLSCTEQTVKNHISSILRKTGRDKILQVCVEYALWKRNSTWPTVDRRSAFSRRSGRERRSGTDRRKG